jgi:hypothetical protein
MTERMPLRDVPVGATLLLPCRLVAKTATTATMDTIGEDRQATGQIQVAADRTVTGAWTADPRSQPVRVVAVAVQVGDVVRNISTGETLVVQAAGLGPDGSYWSPASAQLPSYVSEGWRVVGHIDL